MIVFRTLVLLVNAIFALGAPLQSRRHLTSRCSRREEGFQFADRKPRAALVHRTRRWQFEQSRRRLAAFVLVPGATCAIGGVLPKVLLRWGALHDSPGVLICRPGNHEIQM